MNTEAILKLADLIADQPEDKFDMSTYFRGTPYDAEGNRVSLYPFNPFRCDTAACVAGWEVFRVSREEGHGLKGEANVILAGSTREMDVEELAEQSLDISSSQAGLLFTPALYDRGEDTVGRFTPARAAAVLRFLANTGVVDWTAFDEEGGYRGHVDAG